MKQTIHTLLTDSTARDDEAIAASLQQEFSAGVPWFDEA